MTTKTNDNPHPKELQIMNRIVRLLWSMDPGARDRVLRYINSLDWVTKVETKADA